MRRKRHFPAPFRFPPIHTFNTRTFPPQLSSNTAVHSFWPLPDNWSSVLLKCKLPLLVSFLARRVLFLSRRVSFLSRSVSFLSRITEAFGLEYIINVYTRKTLKMVSFHTGSRGVLFDGIRSQQTQRDCLFTVRSPTVIWINNRLLRTTIVRWIQLEIRSNRTPLLPLVSELHTMKFLIKHLH